MQRIRWGCRCAALALAVLLVVAGLPGTARADYDAAAIAGAAALKEALDAGESAITLAASVTTTESLVVQAGTTVYLNGKVWSVGSGTVSGGGTINLSNGTLVTESGASVTAGVTGTGERRQARTVAAGGVGASETITGIAYADGSADTSPYVQKPLAGGAATIYPLAADAEKAIAELTTDAAAYRLSNGTLSRVYAIRYDLAGGTAAAANPATYTAADIGFALNNPTQPGLVFAGWTGSGLAEATMNVTIPSGTAGDLAFTATWTQQPMGGGGAAGGMGGGGGLTAADGEDEPEADAEEDKAGTGDDGAEPQNGAGMRLSRASSATKVTFADGSAPTAAAAIPGASGGSAQKRAAWPYIAAGILLVAGLAALALRGRRRTAREKRN